MLAFKPIPLSIIPTLHSLVGELSLEHDVVAYLQDVTFIALPSTSAAAAAEEVVVKYARLFDDACETDDRERLGRRMKAEMHLVNGSNVEVVSLHSLTGIPTATPTPIAADTNATAANGQTLGAHTTVPQSIEMSPAYSTTSLATDLSDTEAVTPEMYGSVFEPSIRMGGKSRSPSLETPKETKAGDVLGLGGDAAVTGL